MQKILKYAALALFVFCTTGAHAQHYFGARGGTGSGSSRFYPQQEMGTVWGLYSGGVSWKFYSAEPYVGGIEADVLLMQQGFRRFSKTLVQDRFPGDTTGYSQRTTNTVMVPLFWQPHIYMFKQRLRIFANLGLTFSYVISSRERIASRINGTLSDREYVMKTTRDNRVGYGLCGGGGIAWSTGRLEFFAEARYYFGYSDILKNRNKYESNPIRSPLDGLQLAVGAYWRVGRGGIRSPQNRPSEETILMMQQRREAKPGKVPPEGSPEIPEAESNAPPEAPPEAAPVKKTAPPVRTPEIPADTARLAGRTIITY